jgi:hypothetical protein
MVVFTLSCSDTDCPTCSSKYEISLAASVFAEANSTSYYPNVFLDLRVLISVSGDPFPVVDSVCVHDHWWVPAGGEPRPLTTTGYIGSGIHEGRDIHCGMSINGSLYTYDLTMPGSFRLINPTGRIRLAPSHGVSPDTDQVVAIWSSSIDAQFYHFEATVADSMRDPQPLAEFSSFLDAEDTTFTLPYEVLALGKPLWIEIAAYRGPRFYQREPGNMGELDGYAVSMCCLGPMKFEVSGGRDE